MDIFCRPCFEEFVQADCSARPLCPLCPESLIRPAELAGQNVYMDESGTPAP